MIRAMIVDDEPKGRSALALLLATHFPEVEVIAQAADAAAARTALAASIPDVLFLDIEMPGGSGFELLASLGEVTFDVIFVTAYDHYALKAIKFSALDYLLKPVSVAELREAIAKVTAGRGSRSAAHEQLHLARRQLAVPLPDTLALPTEDGLAFVRLEEIIRADAVSNYTVFHLKGGVRVMVSRTLGEYEEMLAEAGFFRAHNSHLVNMRHVRRYRKGRGGAAIMSDGSEVEISARRRDAFLDHFSRG